MKRSTIPVLALLGLGIVDCNIGPAIQTATCGPAVFNLSAGTFQSFGTAGNAAKVDAFLQATIDLNNAVIDVDRQLDTACRAVGHDLGLTDGDLGPTGAQIPSAASCARVATEIQTIIQTSLPAGAALQIVATPPACQLDLSVTASCEARCTGRAMADVSATCMGMVVADCAGSCTGTCSGACSAMCTGSCTGACTGSCTGACYGTCAGTCAVMDAMGNCAGSCAGTCTGSCSGSCTGACSGACGGACSGSCMGQCEGTCTVASNVRCNGRANVNVDVQCDAACESEANARATCTRPTITVEIATAAAPANQARLNTLLASLRTNYPLILATSARIVTELTATIPPFATSVQGAANAANAVGESAVACFTQATLAAADIGRRFSAEAQVSVTFTAAVTVQGQAH